MRHETKKKWGDETRDQKKGRNDARQKKNNGETRCKTKKMGRQDARQKKGEK